MKSSDIIQWLRQQARQFNERADELEVAFRDGVFNDGSISVTPDNIKSVLKLKGMRIQHLAAHFGLPIEVIRAVVKPEHGLKINKRGWVQTMAQ